MHILPIGAASAPRETPVTSIYRTADPYGLKDWIAARGLVPAAMRELPLKQGTYQDFHALEVGDLMIAEDPACNHHRRKLLKVTRINKTGAYVPFTEVLFEDAGVSKDWAFDFCRCVGFFSMGAAQ